MTSLATACFLTVVLSMISAHDQRKARAGSSEASYRTWPRTALNWALAGLAIVLLTAAWGPERAVALALMLLTLAGAAALVIRRVYEREQRSISIVLLSLLVVLGAIRLFNGGA